MSEENKIYIERTEYFPYFVYLRGGSELRLGEKCSVTDEELEKIEDTFKKMSEVQELLEDKWREESE